MNLGISGILLISTIASIKVTKAASNKLICLSSRAAITRETMIKISAVMLPETSALVTGPGENNFLNFFTTSKI